MRRIVLTFLVALAALPLCAANTGVVRGRVSCEGRGIPGVVVSDGVAVTSTDSRGKYKLKSANPNGYVFISVPSGYEVQTDGLIPRFFSELSGCDGKVDFSLTAVDQSSYNLIVFTDLHLTGDKVDDDIRQFRSDFLPSFINTAKSLQGSLHTLCLGDMSTDGKWYSNSFALPEYLEQMEGYPGPIWHVPGNHDNDRKGDHSPEEWDSFAEQRFKDEIGPNYYSMNIGGVHYLMLDNIISCGPKSSGKPAETYVGKYGFTYGIDPEQLKWIKKDLSYVSKDTPLVVCMHVPLFRIRGMKDDGSPVIKYGSCKFQKASVLMNLVKDYRRVEFLAGHFHNTRVFDVADNMTAHTVASASAVSWKLNDRNEPLVCDDGTPGGFQIFKVENGEISWQYKSIYTDVENSQCSVYNLNHIPEEYGGEPASDAFLVNVFNYDSHWTVKAFEDGLEIPLTQIWGCDPKYIKIRRETRMLLKRPNAFLEEPCLHLFKGRRSSPDSDIQIVLTDRFGREYRSSLDHMAYKN